MRFFFRGWLWRRPWLRTACVVVVGAGGCAATPSAEQSAADYRQFSEQLNLSTLAINAGDLEQARVSLKAAASSATRPAQKQKVQSLDHLIAGAEALRSGDPEGARNEWSRIEEANLAREVRHQARLIGLDVPMVPVQGEATP